LESVVVREEKRNYATGGMHEMNRLEIAQDELLREAVKAGSEIRKVKNGAGDFVKVRQHAYSHPEVRELYMQAFESLMLEGRLRCVLQNKAIELYLVVNSSGPVLNKSAARRVLLHAAEEHGHVYKVHSSDGEFVQVGPCIFSEIEEERILFLQVLFDLFREERLRLVGDSREVAHYERNQPRFPHPEEADAVVVCVPTIASKF
jgi:hypothetical protein